MKVSCVIVSFNSEKWLHKAIASVVAQNFDLHEIIIADDGSTDSSRDIIEAWASANSRVRGILRESNLGTSANRNLAIRDCQGDFVSTLDGDDYYYPDKISSEAALVRAHGGQCVACSAFHWVDLEGRVLKIMDFEFLNALSRVDQLSGFALRAFPLPRDMLFSKKIYLESGGFDHKTALYEDWDFKLRLFRAGAIWKASNVPGLAWRRHPGGGSNTGPEDHLYWTLATLYKNRDWLEKELGRNLVKQAVVARFAPFLPA
ncbi:glycosyltransferase family 2 protein [Desulfocurvibacter africanus]|uniref:glycosyltransferase family 2 protein n=1 Tax=Desulfocurvibacter africanus TaxID=873 RepID=UPI002FDA9BED